MAFSIYFVLIFIPLMTALSSLTRFSKIKTVIIDGLFLLPLIGLWLIPGQVSLALLVTWIGVPLVLFWRLATAKHIALYFSQSSLMRWHMFRFLFLFCIVNLMSVDHFSQVFAAEVGVGLSAIIIERAVKWIPPASYRGLLLIWNVSGVICLAWVASSIWAFASPTPSTQVSYSEVFVLGVYIPLMASLHFLSMLKTLLNPRADGYSIPLDAPGKGLPALHSVMVRNFGRKLLIAPQSIAKGRATYDQETARIEKSIKGGASGVTSYAPDWKARVLVDPIFGIEDSSRYWSLEMALEHLLIVNRAILSGMRYLAKGQTPPIDGSVAAVKPTAKESLSVESFVIESKSLIEEGQALAESIQNSPQKKTTFTHPWFGPLTAKDWFVVMGIHQGIHRQQIQSILRGLRH